ncbi:MAG: 30S ribosomal protein S1 [Gemmataceae bacterium]
MTDSQQPLPEATQTPTPESPTPSAAPPESPSEQQIVRVESKRARLEKLRQGQERRQAAQPSKPPDRTYEDLPLTGQRIRDIDREIEQELEAALGGLSDQELYGAERPQEPVEAGTTPGRKKGQVIRVHGPDVFVHIPGGRGEGVLAMEQFPEGTPAIGTEVEVSIEGYDKDNGLLLLSRKGAAAVDVDWSSVAVGMLVEARVTATNKGGLSVDVHGIRGFMPISQIDLYRVEDAEQFVNQRLRCLVTEVKPSERNLVVSRRALLEKERDEARDRLWQELAEGQTREGIVRSVKPFGAFVDLGGVDGLVHVSEISWSRVADATQVLQPGERVKAVVLKIDHERRKISLGLKQLTASPWDGIDQRYPVGATVTAKVTRLMDFGAFVELEPGVEGLIPVSELSPQRVRRVSDFVKEGQEVQAVVLRLEPDQRRMALSLKAALPPEPETSAEEETEEEAAPPKPPRPRTTPLRGGIGE